jgi:hypothetical protein
MCHTVGQHSKTLNEMLILKVQHLCTDEDRVLVLYFSLCIFVIISACK